MPAFDVAVAPGAPQGMPTAGRVSKPDGVVVVGDCECALVVSGTAVRRVEDQVVVGVTVAAGDAVPLGGVVVTGGGALTIGGGMAVAVAGTTGGVVVTGDKVSTLAGVSSGADAERNAVTPKIPPSATATIVRPSAAACSFRRQIGRAHV